MAVSQNPQLAFAGVDASSAPHLVSDQNAQTATNIDFFAEPGAAFVRRGSVLISTAPAVAPMTRIDRNFNLADDVDNIFTAPFYAVAGAVVYRGVPTSANGPITWTAIAVPPATQFGAVGNAFQQYYFFPGTHTGLGTLTNVLGAGVKDDGTTCTDWVLQSPAAAPTITVNTLAALAIATASGTGWSVAEGQLTVTTTGTTTTTLVNTWSPDPTTLRLQLTAAIIGTNFDLNGTNTIGSYGVDGLQLAFSDPSQIVRISRDYSIGDSSFTNYWHTELTDGSLPSAFPDATVLIQSQLTTATYTDALTGGAPTLDDMASAARTANQPTIALIPQAANTLSMWSVPRTKFDLVNTNPTPPGWTNIQAMRVIVECSASIAVSVGSWKIYGANNFALSDPAVGYRYFVTWGNIDANGNIVGEGAASPGTVATPVQNGNFTVTWTSSWLEGNTVANISHAIFYRQGGYLNDIYCVGSQARPVGLGTTGTFTDTLSDIAVLATGKILNRNVMTRADFTSRQVSVVSEPFYNRIFAAYGNNLMWCLPGKPDMFPYTSYTQVSHQGDVVQQMFAWAGRLAIINCFSVYELTGNTFEGVNANWNLSRTGCRHGSQAQGAVIKTPYGVTMLDYEGLYLYTPGAGIERPLPWVQAQIGDAWQGSLPYQPAALKGGRVPAINVGYLYTSVAAYSNDKLYLACPTGTSTAPDTVYVLNFTTQQCQWFTYPWKIAGLYWDAEVNRVLAGLTTGELMQLELGVADSAAAGTQVAIPWRLRTRAWSAATDNRLENIAVDIETPLSGTATLTAIYDGTSTSVLGTTSNSVRDWVQFSESGACSRDVSFELNGVQSVTSTATISAAGGATTGNSQTILHQIKWMSIAEPERLQYLQTENSQQGATLLEPRPTGNSENWFDVQYSDLDIIKTTTAVSTGTVVAVTYVDNTAVMTNSFVGPSVQGSSGRVVHPLSFPEQTLGHLAHVVYTVTGATDCVFKHWATNYASKPEPDRLGLVSTHQATFPSPVFTRTWVADINPLGTCTGTVFLDDVAVLTQTFTGTTRKVFNLTMNEVAFQTATKVETVYTAAYPAVLKHYATTYETETKPYTKTAWSITYKKAGGATQLDMARFFSLDVDAGTNTATLTATWNVDGVAFSTNTLTATRRQWLDRVSFPPGGRGYLFDMTLSASVPVEIYKSNLDIEMVGVKGYSRRTYAGAPVQNG